MSTIAIQVVNLSKKYEITVEKHRHDTLRDQISESFSSLFHRNGHSRGQRESFWALKDVSFEVKPGEVIGVIGRNGAGKSTLLKILSRITVPTTGFVEIRGRVGSLLEVGTGFHPELTGRENIYLNGAILGMKKVEIKRKFDEIVAFAEIEKFIDTPVKRYSSGMYVRLAFAVAAHLEPEILIVDEVLAVGDARFQRKCLGKMGEVAGEGRTVLFVSHSMPAITRLCPRAILLGEGRLLQDDLSHLVGSTYLENGSGISAMREWLDLKKSPGDEVVRLRSVRVRAKDGQICEAVEIDQPLGIEITYDVLRPGFVLVPSCRISNQEEIILFQTNDWNPAPRQTGRYASSTWIPGNLLTEGTFYVSIGIATPSPGVTIKRLFESDTVAFQVMDRVDGGPMRSMWGGSHPGVVRPYLPWETCGPTAVSNDQ